MTTPTKVEASRKALDRIRALLAKAEDAASTPEESESYAAKAAELMAQYGVDRMMLFATDSTSDVLGDRVIDIIGNTALNRQRQSLLARVAMAMGARVVLRTGRKDGKDVPQVHLFGYGADLERIDMLYASLLIQATNAMGKGTVPEGEWPATWRRSFFKGFTDMVVFRIQQAEDKARGAFDARPGHKNRPGTDIVLKSRADEINAAVEKKYPVLGKARSRSLSGSGVYQGREAGAKADVGATRVTRGGGQKAVSS